MKENFHHPVKTPVAEWLYETRENAGKLNEKKEELFHTVVAKALFVAKRARPNILVAVAF